MTTRCVEHSVYIDLTAVVLTRFLAQIFELQSALEASEGKGANFYSVLGITRSATSAEIKQAYRKRSRELQYVVPPSLFFPALSAFSH